MKFLIPNTYFKSDAPALREIVGEALFNVQETIGEAGRLTEIIKCDRIIVMPGGTGTFEELLYSNETKRSGEHKCRVTLVNIDGYFSGLLSQIEAGIREGLITNNVIHFDIVSSVKQIEF